MGNKATSVLLLFVCLLTRIGYGQVKQSAAPAAPDNPEAKYLHRIYLDSARAFKTDDLKKSLDYITRSIEILGTQGNDGELALSLYELGEVYMHHGQTDLAISNLEESLAKRSSLQTAKLLSEAYIENRKFREAEAVLSPMLALKNLVPYERVEILELLGDIQTGLTQTNTAVDFYKQALAIAEKNQIAPKVTDLTSKIADTYASVDRLEEARAYYDNSLELASRQAPERAIRETEKVADFYNRNQQFDEEIALRKKSLGQIKGRPSDSAPAAATEAGEAVSPQRIAYKLANAYIAKDQTDTAIQYLQESIEEAGEEDDLGVQKDATRTLSELYRERGDFNRALETYREYVALVDTLYRRKEVELYNASRLNREIAEKQSRIDGLEQERELSQSRYELALSEQELIQERNKRQQLIIYFLVFGILLLALTAYFFYRSNRQQKLANNLLALKSLRSQMNPHFIFNALNSVNNYISRNDERSANRYLNEFSLLMRSVLENSEKDFISLDKELELIGRYLKLEHDRFPDKFDYEIIVDESINREAYQIPPMLLQPYIENAIWHGLRYKEEKGYLKVAVTNLENGFLRIRITDNGIGRKRSAALKTENQMKQGSKGMGNIGKRIAILNNMYKDRIAVSVNDLEQDGIGTEVILTIKKAL